MPEELDRNYLRKLAARDCAYHSDQIVAIENDLSIDEEDRRIIKKHYECNRDRAERHYHLLGQI